MREQNCISKKEEEENDCHYLGYRKWSFKLIWAFAQIFAFPARDDEKS